MKANAKGTFVLKLALTSVLEFIPRLFHNWSVNIFSRVNQKVCLKIWYAGLLSYHWTTIICRIGFTVYIASVNRNCWNLAFIGEHFSEIPLCRIKISFPYYIYNSCLCIPQNPAWKCLSCVWQTFVGLLFMMKGFFV